MTATDDAPAATSQRPFQFSLWELLLLMGVCAVVAGLVANLGPLGVAIGLFVAFAALAVWGWRRNYQSFAVNSLVILLCGTCVVALFLPAVRYAGPAARRSQCSNNLKQIALALHNYHDFYGTFPPAYIADADGKPMHSWRVLILPYLEKKPLYDLYDFSEPWDGPNNSNLHDRVVRLYCCPECAKTQPQTETNYVAVIGPQTMWPGDKGTTFGDIADGTSNTLMVVEVRDSGIHWMEPRDLHVLQMPLAINPPRGQGISSRHVNVAQAALADGSVRALSNETPPETIEALLTIAGGESLVDY
jgi:hypothetical protein